MKSLVASLEPRHIKEILEHLVFEMLGSRHVPQCEAGSIDLRSTSSSRLPELFQKLIDSDLVVLHGSTVDTVLQVLEPRQGNDVSKRSGNQCAVYATVLVEVALMRSIINKTYLRRKLADFTLGHSWLRSSRRVTFKATNNLYGLFAAHDPHMFVDGFVYALDRNAFTKAKDDAVEYYALTPQKPILAFRISRLISRHLFIIGEGANKDTVTKYSLKELDAIDSFLRNWGKLQR